MRGFESSSYGDAFADVYDEWYADVTDVDATVVTRMLGAGAKVIGKHMMNGFVGDFGMPLNPHNPAHTPLGGRC